MIFEPHARIQDVAQKVNVLHTGQALKAAGAVGQQQLKDLPHLFLVPGFSAQGTQGIVCALALVPGQVVVGIQQVDVLAQVEADAAQFRGPVVLPVIEQLGHQLPKAAGNGIQILAALGFVPGQPIQTGADGAALAGPAGGGLLRGGSKQRFKAQAQQAVVIVPLVLRVVVVQSHAQVRAVIGGAAGTPLHLPDGVDGAVVTACHTGAFALVQAAQQQIQKGQVIAQGQPPPGAVQRADAAAEPAVGRAVPRLRLRAECGLIRDNISEHGSALLDELGAAAGAGDLDAAAAAGHAQLLAALGAAVVVIDLAVGPLLLPALELVVHPVLQGVELVVLLGALGDVPAEGAVVAEDQQGRAQIGEQADPADDGDEEQHQRGNAQELVQAIGAIAADHKLTKFLSHRFPVLCPQE